MGSPPLEAFGPCEHGDVIEKKAERGGAREPEVESHGHHSLCVVAQARVAEARGEQGEDDADPD